MVTVSIIGAGNMATEHIKAFQSFEDVKISGIYSRSKEKTLDLSRTFNIPFVANSISDLYENTRSDLVVVAVNELSTKSICEEVFDYHWVVLLEKPVGYNFEEFLYLHSLAIKKNSRSYVALNRRHYYTTSVFKQELGEDTEKRIIEVNDQQDRLKAIQFGQPPIVAENYMYANSIHLIDYFLLLGRGRIIHVENLLPWDGKYGSIVLSKILFESGDIGIYKAFWEYIAPWSVTVTTNKQRLELRPLEKLQIKKANGKELLFNSNQNDIEFKPGLKNQALEAIKCVKSLPHSLPSLNETLKTVDLISKIYQLR